MTTDLIEHDGWTLRIRRPASPGPHPVAFLLHGWKGTEDVMWVFANQLPDEVLIIAPRAPYLADEGYSWVRERNAGFSDFHQFADAIQEMETLSRSLSQMYFGDFSRIHLMGFSQGAAACFSWAAAFPGRAASLAALAGFVPAGVSERLVNGGLKGIPVFMAHGTLDTTVPISMMRSAAQQIEAAGANLVVCEDEVGHKLSSNCMKSLGSFYKNTLPGQAGH